MKMDGYRLSQPVPKEIDPPHIMRNAEEEARLAAWQLNRDLYTKLFRGQKRQSYARESKGFFRLVM